jgi:hypothetical protein
MLGVFPICVWSRPTDNGWEARVEARTLAGALVGAAEASCTRDEPNWRDKPDYALRSMAQTRSTSKALRLPLGFVVALAGYEATPAEEAEVARVRSTAQAPASISARAAATLRIAAEHAEDRPIPAATEAQIRAIYAIARGSHGLDDEEVEGRCRERFGIAITSLNRRQASEFIDALKVRP